MSLAPGARLGPYEIIAAIGAGGMGEVYRARDTRLKRDVAIKILPETFAADPDRVARFQREAELLASLNHPNIGHIYGLEQAGTSNALILELVDGPTLADRIAQGPVSVAEALKIAKQIAQAMNAAHEQGIIHRDLKPGNIKLTDDGLVKVLDFGLARLAQASDSVFQASNLSLSPTITSPAMTQMGVILGTATYMSPEQARGRRVDHRTDIWAFGCVLFEMLTGRTPFNGADVSETLASIIKDEPDWGALPVGLPAPGQRLLRRCLAKDGQRRLAHISDALLDIEDAIAPSAAIADPPAAAHMRRRELLAWAICLASVLLALALAARAFFHGTPETFPYRAEILPTAGSTFGSPRTTPASLMAISPDGRKLAYIATDSAGRSQLWMRSLDVAVALPLPGTEGAREPFWSWDSGTIAFISSDGKLQRTSATGGPVQTIASTAAQTGTWNRDDVILFTPTNNSPVHRVSASGGPVVPVTELDAAAGERMHDGPVFLPDGDHFLYVGVGSKVIGPNQARGVFVASLRDSGKGKLLLDKGSNVQYADEHLLFLREAVLVAQRFDADSLQLSGNPVTVVQQVSTGGATGRGGAFSVSQNGVLAYQAGPSDVESRLQWFDHTGSQLSTIGEAADYADVQISDDGKYVATAILSAGQRTHDIWIVDLARNVPSKFTFDAADEVRSAWSPDGEWLAIGRRREGTIDMVRKSVHGRLPEERLIDRGIPLDWSADGQHLLFLRSGSKPADQLDLWILPLDTRKPRSYVDTPFNESFGAFSPDGRWIAYVSNESGSPEVYVDSFPEPGRKQRVSTDGGTFVRWRRDGRMLFYRNDDSTIVGSEVDGGGTDFKVGSMKPLFRAQIRAFGSPGDVSPDGQRFLLNISNDERFSAPITLVLNWPSLLADK